MTSAVAWNRKYRPKAVSELHLAAVRTQLQQFLKAGKVPQALLFAGPKGTGKTSASRIIGAVLNDPQNEAAVQAAYFGQGTIAPLAEPSSDSPVLAQIFSGSSYLVTELDAASNRGIDDVRQLRERAQLPPQGARMSVYILDEAHMLTTEAFNALLKLLEEPPEYAVFILATTEVHKIPDTIISRCHQVQFTKASTEELVMVLENICSAESLTAEPEALKHIAAAAEGSFRDAVKLLENFSTAGDITLEQVLSATRSITDQQLQELLSAVLAKDPSKISEIFQKLRSAQISAKELHRQILAALHSSLLTSLNVIEGTELTTSQGAHFLLTHLAPAELSQGSPIPLLQLELKLLELVFKAKQQGGSSKRASGNGGSSISNSPVQKPNTSDTPSDQTQPQVKKKPKSDSASVTLPEETVSPTGFTGDGKLLCEKWPEFVQSVAQKNSTVAALLQSAQPLEGSRGFAKVQVYYKFHQEQLSQAKFQQLTDECVQSISGGNLAIEYIVADAPDHAEVSDAPLDQELQKLAVEALM